MKRRFVIAVPLSSELAAGEARAVTVGFALLLVLLAVTAGNAVLGIGGRGAEGPIRDWLSSAIYVLVAAIVAVRAIRIRMKRLPWAVFAAGLTLYALGNVLWSLWIGQLPSPPIPSISDGLWLSFYPLSYAGIVGLTSFRGRRRPPAGVWLDGLIAGAGLAAIGAALVFRPLLAAATGSSAAIATELAYPIGDLLLAALVVGVLALRGWRLSRAWMLLGSGFLLLAVADCLYALQVAAGSSRPSPITNLVYVLAVGMLAFASWQAPPRRTEPKSASWSTLLIPAGFMIAAFGLLLYDHVSRLNPLAYGLATLTLLAAILRMTLAFQDIRGLSEARRLAATDDLTSLANRRLFMRRAEGAIEASRLSGATVAVLMLDLDNFKQLNDTLGHHAGDALLRLIGPRLEQALRDGDTVARLGGDEFAVLLHPAPEPAGVAHVADVIVSALRNPFEVHGLALRVTGSVGIASYPADARDADELMQHADIAMYQAKAARNAYEVYAGERNTNSRERLALAAELAAALKGNGLEVHFQPKAEANSWKIVGAEALVRWRRADGRLAMPDEFVGTAEQTGLSRALTRRVLNLALAQARVWRDAGYELHIAVNTTVADLLDTTFPSEVAASLARHRLPADALILEITETSVLADPGRIGTILGQLGALGIGLSLDDFGTGYSSLTHLKSLPVGELKLDRSFVTGMCTDATDAAIVSATIQLAGQLGIRVVAEGVEDTQTWEALDALGCDLIQGYLLGRPVPAAALEQQLASQRKRFDHRLARDQITVPTP
jgi:diguanylate cyclase (GGDEF)-like protein